MRPIAPIFVCLALLVPSSRVASAQGRLPQQPEKSASFGVAVGVSSLLIPISLVATGSEGAPLAALYAVIVGPFPGLAYAGDVKRGIKGMLARGALLGITFAVGSVAAENDPELAVSLGLGWAAGTLASWTADLFSIPRAVEQYNNLSFAPIVDADGRVGARISLVR